MFLQDFLKKILTIIFEQIFVEFLKYPLHESLGKTSRNFWKFSRRIFRRNSRSNSISNSWRNSWSISWKIPDKNTSRNFWILNSLNSKNYEDRLWRQMMTKKAKKKMYVETLNGFSNDFQSHQEQPIKTNK